MRFLARLLGNLFRQKRPEPPLELRLAAAIDAIYMRSARGPATVYVPREHLVRIWQDAHRDGRFVSGPGYRIGGVLVTDAWMPAPYAVFTDRDGVPCGVEPLPPIEVSP